MAKAAQAFWLPPHLEPLRQYFTIAAYEAAHARVALGVKIPSDLSRTERKVAILLVRAINPDEILKDYEEALARGVGDEKLKEHKDRKELPVIMCGVVASGNIR